MAKKVYEMTEEDILDKKKHQGKVIKNLIWLAVFLLIKTYEPALHKFIREIDDYLLNIGGVVSFIGGFLLDLVDLVVSLSRLIFLFICVLAVISLIKWLRRTRGYYESKAKGHAKDSMKWLNNNRELVKLFKGFVQKVKTKTTRLGFDVFDNNVKSEELFTKYFVDARHFDETGEPYLVYLTRYKNYILFSHFSLNVVKYMNLALYLADECGETEYADGFVEYAKGFRDSTRYIHDKRRDGGFI